jgi:hypothetical protein
MNRNSSFIRLFFFSSYNYYIKPIKSVNERITRDKPLQPLKKVAKDAIERLTEATE